MYRSKQLLAALVIALPILALLSIDPIKLFLPVRYLYTPFEIYRHGSIDFEMCMKVALTEEEAHNFVAKRFSKDEMKSIDAVSAEARCTAEFWPRQFGAKTLAYSHEMMRYGGLGYSSGAIYEGGYLYYWAWDI